MGMGGELEGSTRDSGDQRSLSPGSKLTVVDPDATSVYHSAPGAFARRPGSGGAPEFPMPSYRVRRIGQVVTATAIVADVVIRAMPFIVALNELHQALAIVDDFEVQKLALEAAAGHAARDLGLDALPSPRELRHRHFLDEQQAGIDEELAWLGENGESALRGALGIAAPGRKLTGKVSDDLRSVDVILSDIEWRIDKLNNLNIECQVSHRLGEFESALVLAVEGYQTERTKARTEWLALVQRWNLWQPRYQEILRKQGIDTSGTPQSISIESLSEQTTPGQVPSVSSATSPERPEPVHAGE